MKECLIPDREGGKRAAWSFIFIESDISSNGHGPKNAICEGVMVVCSVVYAVQIIFELGQGVPPNGILALKAGPFELDNEEFLWERIWAGDQTHSEDVSLTAGNAEIRAKHISLLRGIKGAENVGPYKTGSILELAWVIMFNGPPHRWDGIIL